MHQLLYSDYFIIGITKTTEHNRYYLPKLAAFRTFDRTFESVFESGRVFASRDEFGRLGHYRNISEIQKKPISETRENENFGKKRLTQGLSQNHLKMLN